VSAISSHTDCSSFLEEKATACHAESRQVGTQLDRPESSLSYDIEVFAESRFSETLRLVHVLGIGKVEGRSQEKNKEQNYE